MKEALPDLASMRRTGNTAPRPAPKGCIYMETSSRGKHSPKTPRFVAEITIHGQRYRFRTTILYSAQCWLEEKQREAAEAQD